MRFLKGIDKNDEWVYNKYAMRAIEDYRRIRINTLERKSGILLTDWIADFNSDNESIVKVDSMEILIGECEYTPLKWKCPACGRWNYELMYLDPAGALVVCEFCEEDAEF